MSVVLRLENVSKAFHLGEIGRKDFFRDWRRKLFTHEAPEDDPELFWALRDVSFDVQEGEVVGLLGRNGAGKSTLLKVISQITAPTNGCVKIKGRIASLLEVGTGFHPDLTGRDNIFLNGVILGMRRREIQAKFDEILDFAGIEAFIDTPVKRYSVGMRVRLGFAVAACLEAELLLVDEVLAVGDSVFQQKCLGKIGDIARTGRTVLFVSHSTATIEALCTRGVVLVGGRAEFDGVAADAIEHYGASRAVTETDLRKRTDRQGDGEIRITAIEMRNARGQVIPAARAGDAVEFNLHYERHSTQPLPSLAVDLTVATHIGTPVFTQANWLAGVEFGELPQRGVFVCKIQSLPLPVGHYHVGFELRPRMRGKAVLDAIENAYELHVESGDFFGTGKLPELRQGTCLVPGAWSLRSVEAEATVLAQS